jgi:hypothetical protein
MPSAILSPRTRIHAYIHSYIHTYRSSTAYAIRYPQPAHSHLPCTRIYTYIHIHIHTAAAPCMPLTISGTLSAATTAPAQAPPHMGISRENPATSAYTVQHPIMSPAHPPPQHASAREIPANSGGYTVQHPIMSSPHVKRGDDDNMSKSRGGHSSARQIEASM